MPCHVSPRPVWWMLRTREPPTETIPFGWGSITVCVNRRQTARVRRTLVRIPPTSWCCFHRVKIVACGRVVSCVSLLTGMSYCLLCEQLHVLFVAGNVSTTSKTNGRSGAIHRKKQDTKSTLARTLAEQRKISGLRKHSDCPEPKSGRAFRIHHGTVQ